MNIEIIDNSSKRKMPTICLNMIVKNESKIISRLLESLVGVIDYFCICDTGSTDNTTDLIKSFFTEKSIPGKIVREPFVDFAYNRSFALKACEDMLEVDYILLLDADMIFWKNPDFSVEEFKLSLKDDAYYIYQGSDNFYYKNTRMVKNRKGMYYWGVTHEFVKTPEGTVYGILDKKNVFINDIGDGGCKSDKFDRDIRLLTKGLEDNPNNDRYTFYLANSYKDNGDNHKAIETYRKRIEIGGWIEEVWFSYYSIGKCYKHLGDMPNAINAWLDAYQVFPKRIENLYEIITHYRQIGKNELSYMFYVSALKQVLLNPNPDYLFLQKDIYNYKLDYEFSILGYYCNIDNYDMTRICHKVINSHNVENSIHQNVFSNYKFYAKQLSEFASNTLCENNKMQLLDVGKELLAEFLPTFVGSTPSIALYDGELVVVQRYVNYRINQNGGYDNQANIETKNVVATFNIQTNTWIKTSEFVMEYNKTLDSLYVGLEDVRIMEHNGKIVFNANRGLGPHNLMVEHGIIRIENSETVSGLIFIDTQQPVEKNWVLFTDGYGNLKIIYGWNDLVIGDVKDVTDIEVDSDDENDPINENNKSFLFEKTHTIQTPPFFKFIRGSTNGILIGDEIWFICHVVSYEDRRYYYHVFVVLDSKTYAVKKYTTMFTMEKEKVEYTLGFVYFEDKDEFLIGYSKMDCQTEYMTISKSFIEDKLCLRSV